MYIIILYYLKYHMRLGKKKLKFRLNYDDEQVYNDKLGVTAMTLQILVLFVNSDRKHIS